jgi:hypothetical protein
MGYKMVDCIHLAIDAIDLKLTRDEFYEQDWELVNILIFTG